MAEEAAAADKKKPDDDSEKTKKILDLARKRFAAAVEAESENRSKELDDLKFLAASPDDNWQWPVDVLNSRTNKSQEGGPRPCVTINKLPQHHRQVTNEQKMNRTTIKFRPANDKAAKETAKVYDGIMRHIQQASEADLAYDTAGDAQVAMGEGYFRILTEWCDERSMDQDIVIAPLADRFKVYLDPIGLLQHPAGKKCQWGFIIEDLPKEEYEDQHGEDNPVDWNDAGIGDQAEWFPNKETVRIAEYLAIEKEKKKLYLFANGATMIEGEELPAGVNVGEQPVDERTTSIPRCIWRKITGQAVLSEKRMPTKYLPIVRVVGNQWIIEGKPVVSGITRNAKDAQRIYNYNASMEVELNALAPKAPFIAMAEQLEGREDQWRKANQVSYGALLYNAVIDEATGSIVTVAAPARAQPAMPQAAVIAAKMAAADDIKSTTGQYDPSLGNNPQAKSGVALQREQVKSEVGTFHYIDNHRRALDYAGTICMDMIPRVYKGKRIARILGEDGEPDRVQLDSTQGAAYQKVQGEDGKDQEIYNLGVGKYDLVSTTGPSFTTKRQEASEFLTNAIQATKDPRMAAALTYLALKSNDWAGAQEATDMVKKLLPPELLDAEEGEEEKLPPQAMAAMQQMKGQMGQLKGQLDAASQALAERDATLKDVQGQLKGKNVEAMSRMYEADKKAMSEIEKAKADVAIARVDAVTAAAAQPDNQVLRELIPALDTMMAQMDQKIEALAASSAAIAEQLQNFEIAARMPAQQPAAAPVA